MHYKRIDERPAEGSLFRLLNIQVPIGHEVHFKQLQYAVPDPSSGLIKCKHDLTYQNVDESTLMNLVGSVITITLATLMASSIVLSAFL